MITAVNAFLDDLRGGRMTEKPIVQVEQGRLQGRIVNGPSGKAFYSFQGIPYAKPPLGSLRFKAPQPPEPWDDVRDATSEGNISAQIDPLIHKQYVGDENCLFLNVYTPNLDGEFLPVMIFIHGGGFRFGSGSSVLYGGDYLVEKDVIVVTINYRCGALGFLSLNTPEVPGNAGLKDIVQAIRWVKQNIHNFGGNSGNLTVFGESCGGVAVSILTASPLTKHLISKAIIQSGTGLNSWAWQKNPLDNARTLAKLLGCESGDIEEILEFLTTTPVKDIVEANEKLHTPEMFYEKGQNVFAPVVEKEFPGVEAVLTEAFIDILTSGRIAEVPIMIGSTALEFTFERSTDDLQIFIPEEFHIERNTEQAIAIAEKIKELYFKGNHTGVESLNEYFELLSDKLVNIDTHRYVQYLVQVTNKPVFYYKFDYVGELNVSKKLLTSLGLKHAAHMDELGYLFKNDFQKDVEPTTHDIEMRERMLRLWTNFAKGGNPTPEENHYLTVTWLPITKDNLYYLNLANELSLGTNPDKEKMEFWDELYRKYFKIWEHPKTNTEEVPRKFEAIVVEETIIADPENSIGEGYEQRKESVTHEIITTTVTQTIVECNQTDNVESVSEIKEEHTQNLIDISGDVTMTIDEISPIIADVEPKVEVVPKFEEISPKFEEIAQKFNEVPSNVEHIAPLKVVNGNGTEDVVDNTANLNVARKPRTSNEIKMVQHSNGMPKDVIRANDPPEDDLPKNIGVNKFVNFFESLGGKK